MGWRTISVHMRTEKKFLLSWTHTREPNMKPSTILRKAAKRIADNEKLWSKEWSWYDRDGEYFDSMLGMCGSIADVVYKHGPEYAELREDLEQATRHYLRPFSPTQRFRIGDYWIQHFSPQDQEHRIIMLLMAADMAEDEGH